jgi:hypothetical protein
MTQIATKHLAAFHALRAFKLAAENGATTLPSIDIKAAKKAVWAAIRAEHNIPKDIRLKVELDGTNVTPPGTLINKKTDQVIDSKIKFAVHVYRDEFGDLVADLFDNISDAPVIGEGDKVLAFSGEI